MKASLSRRLADQARSRSRQSASRCRRVVERVGPGLRVRIDGSECVNFAGNDYLGLAAEAEAVTRAAGGAGASPLITGYRPIHRELEQALADFSGFEAAALFPSGYQANLAVGQALLQRGRGALADRLNHASLNDGLRLAGARLRRYRHADASAAAERLDERIDLIASDGVFSMDGDLAPLAALADLAEHHDTPLWLDDAHGFGVLGRDGRGALEQLSVDAGRIDVFVATFGKALGTAGAFVAGDRALIEHLENVARPLIYSTAPSPLLTAQTLDHLGRLRSERWRRDRLREHVERFRCACAAAGVDLADSATPIQIVLAGDNERALAWSRSLAEAGFLVGAIRPPTVPAGSARLRITLSSAHAASDIDRLATALARLAPHSAARH
jgi:8-amino-7-oxononanoate synthase